MACNFTHFISFKGKFSTFFNNSIIQFHFIFSPDGDDRVFLLYSFGHHFQFRLGQSLVSILAGYFMYRCNGKTMKLKKVFILIAWIVAVSYLCGHLFHYNLKPSHSKLFMNIYNATCKEFLAVTICWVIFACHYLKSGGILKDILEHTLWQPLSKMCLSIYLLHVLYIKMTRTDQDTITMSGFFWQTIVFAGDIMMSVILSGIMFLMIEAPGSQIVELIFKKNNKKVVNSEEIKP